MISKDLLLTVPSEARRLQRSGGTPVAMVPNAFSPFGSVSRFWDLNHEWAFTPNNTRQLVEVMGFDSAVEFRECDPREHGLFNAVRYMLWQAIGAVIAVLLFMRLATQEIVSIQ